MGKDLTRHDPDDEIVVAEVLDSDGLLRRTERAWRSSEKLFAVALERLLEIRATKAYMARFGTLEAFAEQRLGQTERALYRRLAQAEVDALIREHYGLPSASASMTQSQSRQWAKPLVSQRKAAEFKREFARRPELLPVAPQQLTLTALTLAIDEALSPPRATKTEKTSKPAPPADPATTVDMPAEPTLTGGEVPDQTIRGGAVGEGEATVATEGPGWAVSGASDPPPPGPLPLPDPGHWVPTPQATAKAAAKFLLMIEPEDWLAELGKTLLMDIYGRALLASRPIREPRETVAVRGGSITRPAPVVVNGKRHMPTCRCLICQPAKTAR